MDYWQPDRTAVSSLRQVVDRSQGSSERSERSVRFEPGWSKKTVPEFYFCDNFRNGKCTPIFTIFSLLEQEIHAA